MIKHVFLGFCVVILAACGSGGSQAVTPTQTVFQAPGISDYSLVSKGRASSSGVFYDAYDMVSTGTEPSETMLVLIDSESDHDTWIIHVHGGPAGEIVPNALATLHSDYNHIYFQQRGAGTSLNSSGPDYSDLTISSAEFMQSYVADLGFLVRHVRTIDPDSKIVLYGESWGVLYVLLYLVSVENTTYFGPDYRVDGVICDSGSLRSIKANFEANLASLETSTFVSDASTGLLSASDLNQLHADFNFLKAGAASANVSVESNLSFAEHGTTTPFNGYILALFDYIMNMEYYSALKFGVSPPILVSDSSVYASPLDWAQTQANGGVLRTTSLSAADYFNYESRYFSHTGLTASSVLPISTSTTTSADRGAYALLFPILFSHQVVLDHLEVDFDDVPASVNVMFLYGDHDYRYRHAYNSGTNGMCAVYFDHFESSDNDSVGNCIIKPAYDAGHVVRAQSSAGVYPDLRAFLEQI